MHVENINSGVPNISTSPRIGQTTNTSQYGEARQVRGNRQGIEQRPVEERNFTERELIDVIEKANKDFIVYDRRLEFSIHEKTKEIMVKIIDVRTDETIKEIPPEKVLDMVAGMLEIAGILVDRKV